MKYNRVSGIQALSALTVFLANTAHADMAAGKIAGIYQGLGDQRQSIDTTAADNANGREKKAADAQSTADKGAMAAALTGAAMIGTGSPMIPSIIPAVSAAGAELVAKGVQELIQAAASKQAGDTNGAQKDLLLANVDGGTGANPTGGGSSSITLPADLENTLRQNGVNPDAFVQQAMAGNIRDANDVLREMGKPQVSAEDLAKGQAMAAEKMGGDPGKIATAQLQTDENAKNGSVAAGGGAGRGGLGGALDGDAFTGSPGAYLVENHGPAGAAQAGSGAAGADGEGGDAKNAMLAALGFKLGGEDADGANGQGKFSRQTLLNLGILPKQPKQNIFQIAHRNYRSYQKWRQQKKQRLAQK